jgi:hypothetical protein
VRRTLVALPHDRCVRVRVDREETPLLLRVGSGLANEQRLGSPEVLVFGGPGNQFDDAEEPAPTLKIRFRSAGGDLIVRDYPDDIDPREQPDWPGYPVFPEDRPDTAGLTKSESKRTIREWRKRRAEQKQSMERIAHLLDGPCAEHKK